MAKITANAAIGVKLKYFSEYENISPHVSIGIEREVEDSTEEELIKQATELYLKCRKEVEKQIEKDIESAKGKKSK